MSNTHITSSKKERQVFRNGNGSVVGRLEGGWLVKRGLNKRLHHLHRYGAWATDLSHIRDLQAICGKGVRLYLTDGSLLEAPLWLWERHGFIISHDGDQLVLPDRFWTVNPSGGRQLSFLEVT